MLTLRRSLYAVAACAVSVMPYGAQAYELAPSQDVLAFDAASYCASVNRSVAVTKPPEITAALADEAQVDGFALGDAVLASAAMDLAHGSQDAATCEAIFAQGADQFREAYDQALSQVRKEKRHRFAREEPKRSIQQQIAEHWQRDQAARFAYLVLRTEDKSGANFWAARLSVANATRTDEASKRFMEQVVREHGWIDSRKFGQTFADHAWILVQHADRYPEFQAAMLERMGALLDEGGVRPKHYAYLFDRVAVNTGKLQRYGTQPTWECEDGTMALKPMEDPENVNARRATMGLGTVEAGLAEMSRQVCGI